LDAARVVFERLGAAPGPGGGGQTVCRSVTSTRVRLCAARGPRCHHPGEERGYEETWPCITRSRRCPGPDLCLPGGGTRLSLATHRQTAPSISVRPFPAGLVRTSVNALEKAFELFGIPPERRN